MSPVSAIMSGAQAVQNALTHDARITLTWTTAECSCGHLWTLGGHMPQE